MTVAPGHLYHYPLWFVIHSYRGPGPSMQPRTVGQQMWWLWSQAIYTTTHCGSLYIVTVAQGHQCHHTWYTCNVYSMIFTFLSILWRVFAFLDPTGVTLTCLFGEALQNISTKCINKMTTNAFIYGQGHHSKWFLYNICGPGPSIPLPIVVHYT